MSECEVAGCERKSIAKGYCTKHYQQQKANGVVSIRTMNTPNHFVVRGVVCGISIHDRKGNIIAVAVIDSDDVDRCKSHKWGLCGKYIVCGKTRESLHNFILGVKTSRERPIDHINRNPFDNRKHNLRICTINQNQHNSGPNESSRSKCKGVNWRDRDSRWVATISKDNKRYHIGSYTDKNDAILSYNDYALKLHGEFAYLNKM